MADGKETGQFESPEDFDFDATVKLNIGKDGNVASTTAPQDLTPDDFDKTIDGILGIDDLLENPPESDGGESTVSLDTQEIDFDELDAGITALSDEMDAEAAQKAKASKAAAERNEFLEPDPDSSYNGLPLLDEEREGGEESGESGDDFDLGDMPVEEKTVVMDFSEQSDEKAPVIELTEDMLDESDETESSAAIETIESSDDEEDAEPDSVVETPELTTTERHVLSGATSAIREISDDDDDTLQPPLPPMMQPPAPSGGGSGVFPSLLAIIGIAVGGYGAWMAFNATNQIEDMKRQIQVMSPTAIAKKNQEISDIQQRIGKIERRLTGTPTIEAAAPLMSTGGEAEAKDQQKPTLSGTTKPIAKPITPQSEIDEAKSMAGPAPAPKATKGDWVINLSSHTSMALAQKEKDRLQKLGLNAEIHSATVKDKTWYRIQISGYATKNDAKAQLPSVQERSGIKDAWIGKR